LRLFYVIYPIEKEEAPEPHAVDEIKKKPKKRRLSVDLDARKNRDVRDMLDAAVKHTKRTISSVALECLRKELPKFLAKESDTEPPLPRFDPNEGKGDGGKGKK
jgi:hypothetical protein